MMIIPMSTIDMRRQQRNSNAADSIVGLTPLNFTKEQMSVRNIGMDSQFLFNFGETSPDNNLK